MAHADITRYCPKDVSRAAPEGDLERWEIDAKGSVLRFTLRHLVVQQIRGEFRTWGGTLFLDRAKPWLSSVHAWIDLPSIDTGSAERDAHIRSAEFFDVARFPRAEFKSTSIEARSDHVVVRGRLQLHGVTHDLDLEVALGGSATPTASNVYSTRGRLNRQLFGLHWNQDLDVGGIVVGDEVELLAEVRVARADDPAASAPPAP